MTESSSAVRRWAPGRADWQVAALFMIGSACSALRSLPPSVVPGTGGVLSMEWDNVGTFVGAVCSFLGALLLIPTGPQERDLGSRPSRPLVR